MSQEFGPRGIRVNAVSPGPVATDLWLGDHGVAQTVAKATCVDADTARKTIIAGIGGFATGRFTTPEEVATLITFLASDRAANITGANYLIDGGLIKPPEARAARIQAGQPHRLRGRSRARDGPTTPRRACTHHPLRRNSATEGDLTDPALTAMAVRLAQLARDDPPRRGSGERLDEIDGRRALESGESPARVINPDPGR